MERFFQPTHNGGMSGRAAGALDHLFRMTHNGADGSSWLHGVSSAPLDPWAERLQQVTEGRLDALCFPSDTIPDEKKWIYVLNNQNVCKTVWIDFASNMAQVMSMLPKLTRMRRVELNSVSSDNIQRLLPILRNWQNLQELYADGRIDIVAPLLALPAKRMSLTLVGQGTTRPIETIYTGLRQLSLVCDGEALKQLGNAMPTRIPIHEVMIQASGSLLPWLKLTIAHLCFGEHSDCTDPPTEVAEAMRHNKTWERLVWKSRFTEEMALALSTHPSCEHLDLGDVSTDAVIALLKGDGHLRTLRTPIDVDVEEVDRAVRNLNFHLYTWNLPCFFVRRNAILHGLADHSVHRMPSVYLGWVECVEWVD